MPGGRWKFHLPPFLSAFGLIKLSQILQCDRKADAHVKTDDTVELLLGRVFS